MLTVGDWQIRSVVTGHFRLDGGAMFGVVPKTLWAPTQEVDERNRIRLATRTLLAVDRRRGRIVLVDTGPGSKWPADKADRYGIAPIAGAMDAALREVGATADDVTDVVVTHLHFDHAGGMMRWAGEPDGEVSLIYPHAHHWIHSDHWQHAHQPTERDRASFLPEDYEALERAGVIGWVEGEPPMPAIDGVTWEVASGHTPCQLLPRFDGGPGERSVLFIGDVVPTAAHLPPAWIMAYDLHPLTTLAERKRLYAGCARENTLLAFPHDRSCGIAAVAFDGPRPWVAEVLG